MKHLSTLEAATRLGVSSRRIRQFVTAGRLKAEQVGGIWVIEQREFERFANVSRSTGRPRSAPDV